MKLLQPLVAIGVFLASVIAHADPIELNKVDSRIHSRYGYDWQTIEVEAIVDNLAYEKVVQVYYEKPDQSWDTIDLEYKGEIAPGKEVWSIYYTHTLYNLYIEQDPLDMNFVLKYDVNGETYWDNNNEQNYFIAAGSGEYSPKPITLDLAYAQAPFELISDGDTILTGGHFRATFILQNLAHEKDVEVHYTFDGWATSYVGKAEYQSSMTEGYSWVTYPNANNAEVWSFYTDGDEAQTTEADTVEFAVKYTVDGATYWDNNFGYNYSIEIIN